MRWDKFTKVKVTRTADRAANYFLKTLYNDLESSNRTAWENSGVNALNIILSFCNKNLHDFNPIGLSSALHKLAKISTIKGNLSKQDHQILDTFFQTWFNAAGEKLGSFNPQDLSNSLCAMGKLGLHDKRFEASWVNATYQQLDDFNSQDLYYLQRSVVLMNNSDLHVIGVDNTDEHGDCT